MLSTKTLVELEERLIADKTGRELKLIVDELLRQAAQLKSKKNAGVSPEQFVKLEAILSSVDTAIEVVQKTWEQVHY